MTKYNHAFDVAFALESDKEDWGEVSALELKRALLERIDQIDTDGEWLEACSGFDSYEVEEEDE